MQHVVKEHASRLCKTYAHTFKPIGPSACATCCPHQALVGLAHLEYIQGNRYVAIYREISKPACIYLKPPVKIILIHWFGQMKVLCPGGHPKPAFFVEALHSSWVPSFALLLWYILKRNDVCRALARGEPSACCVCDSSASHLSH